jgi:ribosomal protein L11 methyltransferase
MAEPPGWIEVEIAVDPGLEEFAAEAMCVPPLTGATVEPGILRAWYHEALDDPAQRARLGALLREHGARDVRFARRPYEDFATTWKLGWKAFRLRHLAIVPRDAAPRLRATDIRLVLDPGGAFGTGRHGSTRGALIALQRYLRRGDAILDCGSGSGILAVASLVLGAGSAIGFDVDPSAVPHGEELAAENGVAHRARFLDCDFAGLDAGLHGFDGVLANLYLDLHLAHAPDVRSRVRDGGFFVLSGIRVEERDRIVALTRANDLHTEWETRRGRWVTLAGRAGKA